MLAEEIKLPSTTELPMVNQPSEVKQPDKLRIKPKRRGRRNGHKLKKGNRKKLRNRLAGGSLVRGRKSPYILTNQPLFKTVSVSPGAKKGIDIHSIQNIKSYLQSVRNKDNKAFAEDKPTPMATFHSINANYYKKQISFDNHGNKIGFGEEPSYSVVNYKRKMDAQRGLNLASRGTVLKMLSESEADIEPSTEKKIRAHRNLSQPSLPSPQVVIKRAERERSNPSLP